MLRRLIRRGEVHREGDDGGSLLKPRSIRDAAYLHAANLLKSVEQLSHQVCLVARDRLQARANLAAASVEWRLICWVAELSPDPGEMVDRCRHSRHRLKGGRSRLPEIVRGTHLISAVALKERQLPVEEASVWPVELVRRAEEEVGIERLHINGVVRRATYGIKNRDGTYGMCRLHHLLRGIDRAERVGRHANGNDLRARTEERGVVLHIKCAVRRVEADHLQDEPVIFGKESPWAVVRIVIELRHHDLIARLKFARERA